MRRVFKWLLYGAAALALLGVAVTMALKLALNRVPEYQTQIKAWVHDQTGFYVRFRSVQPSLRWYGPELYFDQLELRSKDDQRTLAHVHAGSIALDVWKLIASGKLLAGRIRLEGPEFEITRLGPDRFSFASEIEFVNHGGDLKLRLQQMPRGKLTVRDAVVTLRRWNAALPELKFTSVDLDLTRRKSKVDLILNGSMPPQLQGHFGLRVSADDLYVAGPLSWRSRAMLRDVSLPGWHDLLPDYSNALESGRARVNLSTWFQGAALARGQMDFTAYQVGVAKAAGGHSVLSEVGGVFELNRSGGAWILTGRRVRAFESPKDRRETQFTANWRNEDGALRSLNVEFNYLRLDALLPVVAVLPQKDLRDRIDALGLRGDWFETELRYSKATPVAAPAWKVRARFSHVAFAPIGRAPGFRDLTGSLEGSDLSGGLELRSPGAKVDWPNEWPQPAGLDVLQGSMFWKRTPEGMLFASQNLTAANRDLKADVKFAFRRFDDGQSPQLVLSGAIADIDPTAAPRYLPRTKISPKAMLWLNRAFIAGRIPQAALVYRGPVRSFPFRDGNGLFLARFPAEGLTLDYKESWPRMENVSLDAEFRNQGLRVKIHHATARSLVLQGAEASFADFKTGELNVHAAAHTDARYALDYLANTPLDAMAERSFSKVQASGPLDADVNLFFPFKQFDQRKVLVKARLSGVALALKGFKPEATDLRGDVLVDGAQVPSAQVKGTMLGGPLQLRARAPRSKADLSTHLELHGTMTADGLHTAFDLPASIVPGGRADWRGTVRLVPGSAHERWIRLTSNLVGLDSGLPAPLEKSAQRPMPLFLHVDWPHPGATVMRVGLTPVLRGLFEFESNDEATRFVRGAVVFGTDAPALGPSTGLSVGGSIDRLDLPAWIRARNSGALATAVPSSDTSNGPGLGIVKVRVGEVTLQDLAVRNVEIGVDAADPGWRVSVNGPKTQGLLKFATANAGTAPWDLHFTRLRIDDASGVATSDVATSGVATSGAPAQPARTNLLSDPRAIPAIRFQADQISWRDRDIGAAEVTLSKRDDGVNLDRMKLRGASFELQAEGAWRGPQAGEGRLDGLLTSTNVQETLDQFGYADTMQAKAGSLEFNLHWPGPPSFESVAGLNGQVKISADKGQLVALHPGAGRMLGLASVATLPRRLFLDFSDLTDKGLAFDTIRGDFEIIRGDAYTNNILLDGPAAEIGLVGRVGLAKHDFDQTAVVTGNFGNSLPLASTLAAGPVVGAAVLVFSQVFKQPLKGLARGYYRITGSWDNPTVERVKSDEAAAATRRESKETEGAK